MRNLVQWRRSFLRKWREMNAEGFRNNAMKQDKSLGMLTVNEVLTTRGFEHFTREEALDYIQAMVQFCVIVYTTYSKIESASEKRITNKKLAA